MAMTCLLFMQASLLFLPKKRITNASEKFAMPRKRIKWNRSTML